MCWCWDGKLPWLIVVGKGCGFELIMAVLNWWWVSGEGTKELVVLRTSSGYCRLGVMMVVTALCTALDLLTGLGLICDGEDGRERMRMHGFVDFELGWVNGFGCLSVSVKP